MYWFEVLGPSVRAFHQAKTGILRNGVHWQPDRAYLLK